MNSHTLADTPDQRYSRTEVALIATTAVVGLAYAARALHASRHGRQHGDSRRAALAAYLRDHLAGSDAGLQTVTQIRDGHRDTSEWTLFARLAQEFQDERRVLMRVISNLGASALSVKRLAGLAGIGAGRAAAHRSRDLTLLRTLEALCTGIQGKRCLWRVLRHFEPALGFNDVEFAALESQAVRQWEAVDAFRREVALSAFST